MSYKVTSPLVVIKSVETKADWYGYAGSTVPTGLNDDRCDQLVKEGMLEKVKASKGEKSESAETKPTAVKDILKDVGDDKAKAQEYLDAENSAETPRVSLVEGLQKVLAAEA